MPGDSIVISSLARFANSASMPMSRPSETPRRTLAGRKGLIISGGPSSVYDPAARLSIPAILRVGHPVLGICYGQQLMAHLLGGGVRKGERGEYGFAQLTSRARTCCSSGSAATSQIWMSHRDRGRGLPDGFAIARDARIPAPPRRSPTQSAGSTESSSIRRWCTPPTACDVLSNFVFDICGCVKDWDPAGQIAQIEDRDPEMRRRSQDLLLRQRRRGFHRRVHAVPAGARRRSCTRRLCRYRPDARGRDGLRAADVRRRWGAAPSPSRRAEEQFLSALAGCRSNRSRSAHIIGEEFVEVQERILESRHLLDERLDPRARDHLSGYHRIRRDVERRVIKTHHNRVPGIQKLIDEGRIVEPLKSFYKDEVREIGRELGLPAEFLDRHPFPGPGSGDPLSVHGRYGGLAAGR